MNGVIPFNAKGWKIWKVEQTEFSLDLISIRDSLVMLLVIVKFGLDVISGELFKVANYPSKRKFQASYLIDHQLPQY